MHDYTDILNKINALISETRKNSISPARLGEILYKIADTLKSADGELSGKCAQLAERIDAVAADLSSADADIDALKRECEVLTAGASSLADMIMAHEQKIEDVRTSARGSDVSEVAFSHKPYGQLQLSITKRSATLVCDVPDATIEKSGVMSRKDKTSLELFKKNGLLCHKSIGWEEDAPRGMMEWADEDTVGQGGMVVYCNETKTLMWMHRYGTFYQRWHGSADVGTEIDGSVYPTFNVLYIGDDWLGMGAEKSGLHLLSGGGASLEDINNVLRSSPQIISPTITTPTMTGAKLNGTTTIANVTISAGAINKSSTVKTDFLGTSLIGNTSDANLNIQHKQTTVNKLRCTDVTNKDGSCPALTWDENYKIWRMSNVELNVVNFNSLSSNFNLGDLLYSEDGSYNVKNVCVNASLIVKNGLVCENVYEGVWLSTHSRMELEGRSGLYVKSLKMTSDLEDKGRFWKLLCIDSDELVHSVSYNNLKQQLKDELKREIMQELGLIEEQTASLDDGHSDDNTNNTEGQEDE